MIWYSVRTFSRQRTEISSSPISEFRSISTRSSKSERRATRTERQTGVSLLALSHLSLRRLTISFAVAPEVIQLQGASPASDIWSLASTIIELITGKPPYGELYPMSAMFRIVEDDHPPIPQRCSPLLSDFLIACFQKEPRNRPTAEELFDHPWLQTNWDSHKVSSRSSHLTSFEC